MSQIPYQDPSQYNASLNYASPGANLPPARPGAVTGLAIAGIVLGSIGILCGGFGLIGAVAMLAFGGKGSFAGAPMPQYSSTFIAVSVLVAVLDLLFWAALLTGSIASLKLRPIARQGLLLWSWGMLLWQVGKFLLQVTIVLPETTVATKKMLAAQPANPMAGSMSGMMSGIAIGSAVFWLVVLSVLPILFLTMWTRPRIKAAFDKGPAQQPPNAPPYAPMP